MQPTPNFGKALTLAKALALLLICLSVPVAQAKELSPEHQLEQQLGTDLLSAKASAIEAALTACVQQNRSQCHRFAPAALSSGRADANAIAPYLVAASIEALGKTITQKELSNIIFASVKVTPDAVLEIVDASARIVPKNMVQPIVTAATNAVPDPYKMVKMVKKKSGPEPIQELTASQNDFKGSGDFKNVSSLKGDSQNPASEGESETLAQAIVDTAALASGASDLSNPGQKLELLGATVTAPIGTAGDSNYGNEPRVEAASIPVVSQ